MKNKISKRLLFAINEGIYVVDGLIYVDQLIDFAGKEHVLKEAARAYFFTSNKFLDDWWQANKHILLDEFIKTSYTSPRKTYEFENLNEFATSLSNDIVTFLKSKRWYPGMAHVKYFVGRPAASAIIDRLKRTIPTSLDRMTNDKQVMADCAEINERLFINGCVRYTALKEFFGILDRAELERGVRQQVD